MLPTYNARKVEVLSTLVVATPPFALRCTYKLVGPTVSEFDHEIFYNHRAQIQALLSAIDRFID